MEELNTSWWGGGGCCRPRPCCGQQSVFAPAPQMGYNVQHPVMVPNEPFHRVDFHPEYWQFPQGGQFGGQQVGFPGMGYGMNPGFNPMVGA